MAVRQRRVEVHQMTISGLQTEQTYGQFLRDIRDFVPSLEEAVMEHGEKSHALYEASVSGGRLRLSFISFTTGYRPDILDMERYELEANPLTENQTGVAWTHCLGGSKGNRYLLLVEKVREGIWPGTIEEYLQWLVDSFESQDEADIVISVEAVADETFLQRLGSLDRIRKAMIRISRPNPGWNDLETELGDQSSRSDAGKSEVSMYARRGESLEENDGIVAAIKERVPTGEIDYARIEGELGEAHEAFDTKKLGKARRLSFQLDEYGQVRHSDAWRKLGRMFNEL